MRYLSKLFALVLFALCLSTLVCAKGDVENKRSVRSAKCCGVVMPLTQHAETELENNTSVITVFYGGVSCTCAQWATSLKQDREYIYLEPANKRLIKADNIWDGSHLPLKLRVTGSFLKHKGLPLSYQLSKDNPNPARIFKYTKIEILSVYFKSKKHWGINTQ